MDMDIQQRFCVRWNSYKSNLQTAFPKLLTSEHFVDVTLACEKQFIKCHKIVLSACSAYFETLLVNNPCQHPIIFMKDIQFWEIKALVEFMYKGEVNVCQNQLDSLLKSAESLQIRGLSGTKQFVNLEQSDEVNTDECGSDGKSETKPRKSGKSDEGVEEECSKRKRRRNDNDEENGKCVQITSVRGSDETVANKKQDVGDARDVLPSHKPIKEEAFDQEDYEFENNYGVPRDEDETQTFGQDAFYTDHNHDPGPSGMPEFISLEQLPVDDYLESRSDAESTKSEASIGTSATTVTTIKVTSKSDNPDSLTKQSKKPAARPSCYKQYTMASMWAALERIEQGLSVHRASLEYGVPRKTLRNWMKKYNILNLCSLALNNVECVMDHEKTKRKSSSSSPTPGKNSSKSQQRHQEHNYTNPAVDDTCVTITKVSGICEGSGPSEREPPTRSSRNTSRSAAAKLDRGDEPAQRSTGGRASSTAQERSSEVKTKTVKKDVFNRIRRSEEELQKAAEMVRGGMTFQTASDTFNIPISTIRFYMARRGILPQRRRGRGSSGVRDDDLIHPPFEIIHYRLPDIDKPI